MHGLPAGLHAVVDLPDGRTEEQAVAEAQRRGLAVQGLTEFAFAPGHAPALVVGYATPPAHAFTIGGGPPRRDPQPIRRTSRTTTAVIAHQISAAVP